MEDDGIRAGKVNCDAHQRLCQEAQVSAYPSVRFYAGTAKTRPTQVSTQSSQMFFQMLLQLHLFIIYMLGKGKRR